jgi:hypothetical protein
MGIHRLCGSVILAIAIVAFALQPARAWGQQADAPTRAAEAQLEESIPTAPVTVDGVVLFRVRGISSYPAEERAKAIAGRIAAVAANPAFSPDALRIEDSDVASQVIADQVLVVNVHESDARLEGVGRKVLATAYVVRIRTAITSYRADRSAPALQRAAVRALTATAFVMLTLIVILWTWRRLDAWIENRYRDKVERLTAKSREVVSAEGVWTSLRTLFRFIRSAVLVVLAFLYLQYVLALFPQTPSPGA